MLDKKLLTAPYPKKDYQTIYFHPRWKKKKNNIYGITTFHILSKESNPNGIRQ